jgi:hypothetical protein
LARNSDHSIEPSNFTKSLSFSSFGSFSPHVFRRNKTFKLEILALKEFSYMYICKYTKQK